MNINSILLQSKKRKKLKQNINSLIIYISSTLIAIILFLPFFVLITRSLMGDREVITIPVRFFPSALNFDSYKEALDPTLLMYTKNTLIVVLTNIIFVPFSAALCAFGFSKMKFWGKEVIFAITLATVMLPSIVVQIPLYVMFVRFGWINTLLPLIIPGMFGGGALNIFLIRQFMRGVPNDLQEACTIDGGSWFRFFFQIMVPLCLPVIMLTMVNTFLGVWNDFMGPLIYLKRPDTYTLAVGVFYRFLGGTPAENLPNVQMAVGALMVIPPAIAFLLFQKQLVEGISLSGLKA